MEQEEDSLSNKILDYINSRKQDRLEKFDKDTEKGKRAASDEELAAYEQQRYELRATEEARFKAKAWLTDAAKRAKQLQLVTHAIKFTHSDAKGTSLYSNNLDGESAFISTQSLDAPEIDIVGNAAALDVGKLLMLQDEDGKRLVHFIQEDDTKPLEKFAESPEQLADWLAGFKLAVTAQDPSSHKHAKQLYWPIEDDYHLLLPLFSSSLAHKVFEHVQYARFSEEQKEARKARREGKDSEQVTVEFPNIAIQAFGGTKPQNISQLNSSRGGKAFLLSSAPPTWESQEKPPLKTKSVFRGPFSRKAYPKTKALREFLVRKLAHRSVKAIRAEREYRIDDIVDELIAYTAVIRRFPAGWTLHPDCLLPEYQKLWLDPKRCKMDDDFRDAFDLKEWQGKVAEDFSRFLNSELEKNKQIATGDPEYVQWKVLSAQKLRLIKDDIKGALDG